MLMYRNVDELLGMSDWCIILPIKENGTLKVRVYMRNKKALKGTYQKIYTYYIDRQDLKEIYSYESLGKAYNEIIKYRKQRCKAFGQLDLMEGQFDLHNIRIDQKRGSSDIIFEMLVRFELSRIREKQIKDDIDKHDEKDLEKEIDKYDDWENLGYDY